MRYTYMRSAYRNQGGASARSFGAACSSGDGASGPFTGEALRLLKALRGSIAGEGIELDVDELKTTVGL